MVETATTASARRVIVGDDKNGRSAVLVDEVTGARTLRPNGSMIQEIWRQGAIPALASDDGTRSGEVDPGLPPNGFSVRIFTIPPHTSADSEELHSADCVYVATVVSGLAILVLETGEVELSQGDSFVLPGSMHTWRNPYEDVSAIVTTVFPKAAVDG